MRVEMSVPRTEILLLKRIFPSAFLIVISSHVSGFFGSLGTPLNLIVAIGYGFGAFVYTASVMRVLFQDGVQQGIFWSVDQLADSGILTGDQLRELNAYMADIRPETT